MSYHDILLPSFLEPFLGAKQTFSTSKVTCASGRELRSSDHSYAINHYQLKDCFLSEADFVIFNNFFKGRRGSRFAFKLKDFADYSVEKQIIAMGGDEKKNFQLQKAYADEKHPYIRKITKVRKDSVKIYLDQEENNQWKLNENTGLLEMGNPVPENTSLSASFEFYVIVRFADDSFDYDRRDNGAIEVSNVSLIEVLE
jgi:uncharacterized protein (TIGR02217 family)